ncbi:hypothetical protein BT96DRAFT_923410, partial [Gymnopus androsaceus JB14]
MFPASIPDSLDYPDLDEYPETLIGNSVAKTSAEELTIDAIEDTVDDSCAVKIIGIYHLHLDLTLKNQKRTKKRNRAYVQAPNTKKSRII